MKVQWNQNIKDIPADNMNSVRGPTHTHMFAPFLKCCHHANVGYFACIIQVLLKRSSNPVFSACTPIQLCDTHTYDALFLLHEFFYGARPSLGVSYEPRTFGPVCRHSSRGKFPCDAPDTVIPPYSLLYSGIILVSSHLSDLYRDFKVIFPFTCRLNGICSIV